MINETKLKKLLGKWIFFPNEEARYKFESELEEVFEGEDFEEKLKEIDMKLEKGLEEANERFENYISAMKQKNLLKEEY